MAHGALLQLARAVGTLHARTARCTDAYVAHVRASFPNASIDHPSSLPDFEWLAQTLVRRLGGHIDACELAELAGIWDNPGAWTVLNHGDPCPDNAMITKDGEVELLDFEFARPGHALHDVAFWHMGFPSCWCAGAVPPDLVAHADGCYRQTVAPAIELCADDSAWRTELARQCVLLLLLNAPRLLESALTDNAPWGTARLRERLFHWLRTCQTVLETQHTLPGFMRSLETWVRTLEGLDADSSSLTAYRAFKPDPLPARLAMAVVVRDGTVLMQHRWRRGIGFVHEFPGGRADDDESLAQAACRELQEETGLIETEVLHESIARSRHGGAIAFVVLVSSSGLRPQRTSESRQQDFTWLSPADIPITDLAPADAAFVREELPAIIADAMGSR